MVRNSKIFRLITIISIAIYGIVMGWLFSYTNAKVPDEIWFYGIINDLQVSSLKEFILIENYLGYGSLYWMILYVLNTFSNIRVFCWLCLISMPITLVLLIKKVFNREWVESFAAIFLYLSCPINWFTGKIIGPEIISNAFGCVGLFLLMIGFDRIFGRSKISQTKELCLIFGGGLIGIASGIKLYNIVFAVFFVTYVILEVFFVSKETREKLKKLMTIVLPFMFAFIIAFILTNPIMVFDRQIYLENQVSGFELPTIDGIYQLIYKYNITWDLVNSSGLNFLIVSVVSLIIIWGFAIVRKKNRNIAIAGIASFVFLTLLFSISTSFQGWYYMPIVFIISIAIGGISTVDWIVLLMNLFLMLPNIYFQIDTKLMQVEVVEAYDNSVQAIIDKYLRDYEGCELIDFSSWQVPKDSNDETLWDYNITKKVNPQIIIISSKVLKYADENNQVRAIANCTFDDCELIYDDDIFRIIFYKPNLRMD